MRILDTHKALLITVLLTGIFVLTLSSLKLSSTIAQEKEIRIDLENVNLLEEILEEQMRELAENTSIETHKAFNEADNPSQQNPTTAQQTESTQGRKTETSNRQKSRDELLLEELENERLLVNTEIDDGISVPGNVSPYTSTGTKKPPKKEKISNADNAKKNLAIVNTANKNSSNYFNLPGRSIQQFPNPIYTCPSGGKIVINITVNVFGKVTETSFNQGSSTSSNGCLVDTALAYAKDAVFNSSNNNPDQIGTITYIFPGQIRN